MLEFALIKVCRSLMRLLIATALMAVVFSSLATVTPITWLTQYSYDSQGSLETNTDLLNHVTSNDYDVLTRLTSLTYGDETIGFACGEDSDSPRQQQQQQGQTGQAYRRQRQLRARLRPARRRHWEKPNCHPRQRQRGRHHQIRLRCCWLVTYADHLGTPRAITRPSDNAVVWKWENS